MKIGFDVSQTGKDKAGCGYFADSLIQALTALDHENEYILYPHFGTTFWDPEGQKTTRRIDRPNVSRIVTGRNFHDSRKFWKKLSDNGEQILGGPDIIHANNFSCPHGIRQAKVVYTIYDIGFLIYPEFTSEENRWICFEGVFNAACHADFLVAISNYSRNSFLEVFPHYPADRVKVAHLGSRFSSFPESLSGSTVKEIDPDRFWLAVGTLEPRKNLRRLINAYAEYILHSGENRPLVLAGGNGWLEDDLDKFIGKLGIGEHVRVLGYVTDDELIWLYKNCFAFLYPSLFEGFGLPVLEALSLGAAVVTSNVTSLPEVAGNSACYVDPLSVQEIANALAKLAGDEEYRRYLKNRSKRQAQKFSWERCAAQVMDMYREVMDLPKRVVEQQEYGVL